MSDIATFRNKVFLRGLELYRDLPWRNTRDAYAIWISEVMLQQTQVSRVDGRWQHWLERFPSADALAAASVADVLDEWQGMGYNRRALALRNAAIEISQNYAGELLPDAAALKALPGIGPATATGICAFAYDLPGIYLETNVRTVFLHELMPEAVEVPDKVLTPMVAEACPAEPLTIPGTDQLCTPRSWYYALLDYGAHLKKTLPNPSRRSKTHTRQSKFEGSHRQKRAEVVRILLASPSALTLGEIVNALNEVELKAGRSPLEEAYVKQVLADLTNEGFCTEQNNLWICQ